MLDHSKKSILNENECMQTVSDSGFCELNICTGHHMLGAVISIIANCGIVQSFTLKKLRLHPIKFIEEKK